LAALSIVKELFLQLHNNVHPIPNIPRADLPPLATTSRTSTLTRTLASASPKGMPTLSSAAPLSPSRSPTKPPVKRSVAAREFAIPFPITPSKVATDSKNSLAFPQTPSRYNRPDPAASLLTPQTPSTSGSVSSEPSTPANQKGANATTVPKTPTTSRRQALYDRVRQRSLTSTPSKASNQVPGGKLSKDQMMKMGQEEMRRRCLLGRLGGVAESVWMYVFQILSA
jgi:hypothetical protein